MFSITGKSSQHQKALVQNGLDDKLDALHCTKNEAFYWGFR